MNELNPVEEHVYKIKPIDEEVDETDREYYAFPDDPKQYQTISRVARLWGKCSKDELQEALDTLILPYFPYVLLYHETGACTERLIIEVCDCFALTREYYVPHTLYPNAAPSAVWKDHLYSDELAFNAAWVGEEAYIEQAITRQRDWEKRLKEPKPKSKGGAIALFQKPNSALELAASRVQNTETDLIGELVVELQDREELRESSQDYQQRQRLDAARKKGAKNAFEVFATEKTTYENTLDHLYKGVFVQDDEE